MAELGEAFNPAVFVEDDLECPFAHETPDQLTIENRLVGNGQTLQTRMGQPSPSFLEGNPLAKQHEKDETAMPNPKAVKDHPFYDQSKTGAIKIDLKRPNKENDIVDYKVSCAAHHLIPAQESLKESALLEYMMKEGEKGEVKTGKAKGPSSFTGKCWTNAGYDVNGSQNGVFLPGSYAVGGSKAGEKAWIPVLKSWAPPVDDEEDVSEDQDVEPPSKTAELSGEVDLGEDNRKWMYVRRAVELAASYSSNRGYGGQFHDRHEDYSLRVIDILTVLHGMYQMLEETSLVDGGGHCDKCSEAREKNKKLKGIPTPFEVVERLNLVSKKLEERLKAIEFWYPKIYTSAWGQAFIYSLEQAKKKRKR